MKPTLVVLAFALIASACTAAEGESVGPTASTSPPATTSTVPETSSSQPVSSSTSSSSSTSTTSPPAPPTWLKGQLHLHATSADMRDESTPEEIVERYEDLGFDFIVITDHNFATDLSDHEGPMSVYVGVELELDINMCESRPHDPVEVCRIHIGTLLPEKYSEQIFAEVPWRGSDPLPLGEWLVGLAEAAGGVTVVNHPALYWAVDGPLLVGLWSAGAALVEIVNTGPVDWVPPDEAAPDAEDLWDFALSRGARLYGVASDDSHARAEAGFGWVMVWSTNTEDSIRAALLNGDFYSSTGVTLSNLEVTSTDLVIEVDELVDHVFEFIGPEGVVLATTEGTSASFTLAAVPAGGYVRSVVTAPDGTKAWTQPIWVGDE